MRCKVEHTMKFKARIQLWQLHYSLRRCRFPVLHCERAASSTSNSSWSERVRSRHKYPIQDSFDRASERGKRSRSNSSSKSERSSRRGIPALLLRHACCRTFDHRVEGNETQVLPPYVTRREAVTIPQWRHVEQEAPVVGSLQPQEL